MTPCLANLLLLLFGTGWEDGEGAVPDPNTGNLWRVAMGVVSERQHMLKCRFPGSAHHREELNLSFTQLSHGPSLVLGFPATSLTNPSSQVSPLPSSSFRWGNRQVRLVLKEYTGLQYHRNLQAGLGNPSFDPSGRWPSHCRGQQTDFSPQGVSKPRFTRLQTSQGGASGSRMTG